MTDIKMVPDIVEQTTDDVSAPEILDESAQPITPDEIVTAAVVDEIMEAAAITPIAPTFADRQAWLGPDMFNANGRHKLSGTSRSILRKAQAAQLDAEIMAYRAATPDWRCTPVAAAPPIAPEPAPAGNAERNEIPFHQLAELFPTVNGQELEALATDIKEHGQKHPIIMYQKKILDGRGRYIGCLKAGVEPRFETYDGNDPDGLVVSLNIRRRHLTTEQKRALIEKLLQANPERSNLAIANLAKVSDKTVAPIRKKMVAGSEIPNDTKRTDTRGHKQPAAKPKKSKLGATKASEEDEPAAPAPDTADQSFQPQSINEASATASLPESDANGPADSLIEFATFVLARIDRQGDTIIIAVTAEDLPQFNDLAGRVSVITQKH
jgi:hypothetical protein